MRRNGSHDEASSSGPTIAIVEADSAIAVRLGELLGTDAYFHSLEDLELRLPSTRTVAVLGPSNVSPGGFRDIEDLLQRRAALASVLVVDRLTTRILQGALRAGMRDVIRLAEAESELPAVIQRVAGSVPDAPVAEVAEPGRVITVFSTK